MTIKERPILMNGAMVRATLEGRKTQTRRAVKLPHMNPLGVWEPTTIGGPNGGHTKEGGTIPEQGAIWHTRTGDCLACQFGQPGDRLWVRENWAFHKMAIGSVQDEDGPFVYAADGELAKQYRLADKWTPSIHMPRWASRILLEIVSVRVERLQDISNEDALAEGLHRISHGREGNFYHYERTESHPNNKCYPDDAYRELWESINGIGSWDVNPWVWVIEFKELQMADQRKGGIAWTEETWNPLRGCSRVSEGCRNCYAEAMAARFCGSGQPYEGTINLETKRWSGNIRLVPERLSEPLRWQRPRMVFVNSMSDLFHESVPDEFIDKVFAVMALAHQHTFQVLTKRPERMLAYMNSKPQGRVVMLGGKLHKGTSVAPFVFPLPNVWLGVTVEDQDAANERIPLLLQTPAAVRWVSMEPLLGPVSFRWMAGIFPEPYTAQNPSGETNHLEALRRINWIVVGGESGTNARPMHPDWARSLRDQCEVAGVPFLFKQWGEFSLAYNRDRDDPDYRKCDMMDKKHGRWINLAGGHGFNGERVHYAERIGKKAAGRLLDGVLHDGYPISGSA